MLDQNRVDLSTYRLEKAEEMLGDAITLLQQGSLKSSNNRAYYCIYHAIRAIFALDGVEFKKHSGNITFFLKDYVRTGIFDSEVSEIVLSASKIRSASDYDDFYIASRSETEKQVEGANRFLSDVKAYLSKRIEADRSNKT